MVILLHPFFQVDCELIRRKLSGLSQKNKFYAQKKNESKIDKFYGPW